MNSFVRANILVHVHVLDVLMQFYRQLEQWTRKTKRKNKINKINLNRLNLWIKWKWKEKTDVWKWFVLPDSDSDSDSVSFHYLLTTIWIWAECNTGKFTPSVDLSKMQPMFLSVGSAVVWRTMRSTALL